MFYFGEIIAIAICWLFYCEFRWVLERKVRKVCSREYISKRCVTFFDKLFFTPVSGKVNFGILYYFNVVFFFVLAAISVFHIILGWIEPLHGVIKAFTTVVVLILGLIGASCSVGSSEDLCINKNVMSKKLIIVLQVAVFICELVVILMYLYVAWAFIP